MKDTNVVLPVKKGKCKHRFYWIVTPEYKKLMCIRCKKIKKLKYFKSKKKKIKN